MGDDRIQDPATAVRTPGYPIPDVSQSPRYIVIGRASGSMFETAEDLKCFFGFDIGLQWVPHVYNGRVVDLSRGYSQGLQLEPLQLAACIMGSRTGSEHLLRPSKGLGSLSPAADLRGLAYFTEGFLVGVLASGSHVKVNQAFVPTGLRLTEEGRTLAESQIITSPEFCASWVDLRASFSCETSRSRGQEHAPAKTGNNTTAGDKAWASAFQSVISWAGPQSRTPHNQALFHLNKFTAAAINSQESPYERMWASARIFVANLALSQPATPCTLHPVGPSDTVKQSKDTDKTSKQPESCGESRSVLPNLEEKALSTKEDVNGKAFANLRAACLALGNGATPERLEALESARRALRELKENK